MGKSPPSHPKSQMHFPDEVMEGRTDDLYAVLGPAGGLEGLAGFVDADLAAVDELVGVLFVPSAAQGVSTRCRRGQRLARRVNLPGLGVVLGVFDLVDGDNVRVLVEDEEAGRAGGRGGGSAGGQGRGKRGVRGAAVERANEVAVLEPRHVGGGGGGGVRGGDMVLRILGAYLLARTDVRRRWLLGHGR